MYTYKQALAIVAIVAMAGSAQAHDAGENSDHGEFEFEVDPGGLGDVGPCSLLVLLHDADFQSPVYFRLYLEDGTLVEERVGNGGPDLTHAIVFEFSPEEAQGLARVEMNYTEGGVEHRAHAAVEPFSCDEQDDGAVPFECPAVDLTTEARGDGSIFLEASGLDQNASLMRSAGGESEEVARLDGENTSYVDSDTEPGTTYTYELVIEGEPCAAVEVTAIPVFPSLLAGGAAVGVSMLGYAAFRRRQ